MTGECLPEVGVGVRTELGSIEVPKVLAAVHLDEHDVRPAVERRHLNGHR